MKKKHLPFTNIGSISLLMVFLVLCMVTLAALSLSSAAADSHEAEQLAQHHTAYYEACNEGEKKLAQIQQVLTELSSEATNESQYQDLIVDAFLHSRFPEGISLSDNTAENGLTISWQEPISDRQYLSVILTLSDLSSAHENAAFWKITSWQECSSADWNADQTLHLIP